MTAVSLYALFALILFAVVAAGVDRLPVLMALLFVAFACLGLVIPATMVLALEEHGPIAGMASALGGTLQMVAGGLVIVIVSLFFDGTALPMVAAIAARTGRLAEKPRRIAAVGKVETWKATGIACCLPPWSACSLALSCWPAGAPRGLA